MSRAARKREATRRQRLTDALINDARAVKKNRFSIPKQDNGELFDLMMKMDRDGVCLMKLIEGLTYLNDEEREMLLAMAMRAIDTNLARGIHRREHVIPLMVLEKTLRWVVSFEWYRKLPTLEQKAADRRANDEARILFRKRLDQLTFIEAKTIVHKVRHRFID